MQISVTFRHMESNEELRAYTDKRLQKIVKFLAEPVEVNVVFSVEKFRQRAEMTINSKGIKIKGQEEKDDMYAAIDLLIDNIQEQIRRSQEKKRRRNCVAGREVYLDVFAANQSADEPDTAPRIVKREVLKAKPMYVAEAIAQMRLTKDDFLVFTNAESEVVNVLYRRKDRDLGLIASQ